MPNLGFQINGIDIDSVYVKHSEYKIIPSQYSRGSLPGTLWGVGNNAYGQLGDGSLIRKSSPVQIGSLNTWKDIAVSIDSTMAIKTDGTLWGWGENLVGAIGDGTRIDKSSPIQIGSLTNWAKIIGSGVGENFSAIKTDGTLWSWGDNTRGQLGDSTSVPKSSPVQIGSLTNWKQVSLSYFESAGIKTDGTMWAWGGNNFYQLGNGTTSWASSPIQVGSLTSWSKVSIGGTQVALKTDGSLWVWGYHVNGSYGTGYTSGYYSTPTQLGTLTNWKSVYSADQYHITAIKTDGTLWSWGDNTYGQLGDGTIIHKSSPVQIGSLTNWSEVFGGYFSMYAIKTDGTLWVWGRNAYGELGDGTIINKSSPIQIGSLSNWIKCASKNHTILLTY